MIASMGAKRDKEDTVEMGDRRFAGWRFVRTRLSYAFAPSAICGIVVKVVPSRLKEITHLEKRQPYCFDAGQQQMVSLLIYCHWIFMFRDESVVEIADENQRTPRSVRTTSMLFHVRCSSQWQDACGKCL